MSLSYSRFVRLDHEAMATTFALTLVGEEDSYLRQAGLAACDELDRIEGRLSRNVEHSDVARLNRLPPGESLLVHPDTFRCLAIAAAVERETYGAFDVTYASGPSVSHPRLQLDSGKHAVRIAAAGTRLDLGGIGKGYALDRMAEVLVEWDVTAAMLCASTSTVLALRPPPGEPGWIVTLGPHGSHDQRVRLAGQALSGSGKSVRGEHIIDPATGKPAQAARRAWAAAPTGAVADALSTAFMVMSEEAVGDYCRAHADVSAGSETGHQRGWITVADRLAK